MNNQQPPAPQQRKLTLDIPASLSATYSNAVIITQTNSEIVLDFLQVMPNDPRARLQSRIVMTPMHAKLLLKALGQNLERYEEKHGEIQTPQQQPSLAEQLFGGLKPDATDDGSAATNE